MNIVEWKVKDRAYYQNQACTIEQIGGSGKYKGKVKVITADDFEGVWIDAGLLTQSKNGRKEPISVGKTEKIPTAEPKQNPITELAKEVNERELHHWYKKAIELQRRVLELEQERDHWRQLAESTQPNRKPASGSLSEPATGNPIYSWSVKVDDKWKTRSRRVPVELVEKVRKAIVDELGIDAVLGILDKGE